MHLNDVFLAGELARDPEVRFAENGYVLRPTLYLRPALRPTL